MRFQAGYNLTFMDEFADELLSQERVCDIILPRIAKRSVLEDLGELGPRRSLLLDVMEGREKSKSHSPSRSVSRSRSPPRSATPRDGSVSENEHRGRSQSRFRSPINEGRYISRSRSKSKSSDASERFRSRSRSISQDRMQTD